jgi:hypothetical protein
MARRHAVMRLVALCVVTLPLVALNVEALLGDPTIYRNRLLAIFSGGVPYVDTTFEHFPLAAVPMVVAWILGGAVGPGAFTAVFASLMFACLLATTLLVDYVGEHSGIAQAGRRWLVLVAPILPLVLFRYDPWVVALVAAGLASAVAGQDRKTALFQLTAIAAKGWPIVLAVPDWLGGRRLRAAASALVAVALVGSLVALPGFRSVRSFSGIHTDTVVGAWLTLFRSLAGEPVRRLDAAGAIYVEAPAWTLVVGLNLGLAIAALALMRISPPVTREAAFALTGALTIALLLASPLLSPQFILWVVPFLALHRDRRVHVLGFAVVALTALFMLGWDPLYEGRLWWVPVLHLRNVALLVLGVAVAWSVGSVSDRAVTASSSRVERREQAYEVAVVR